MATYSLDLKEIYDVVDNINKVIDYFRRYNMDYELKPEDIIARLKEMKNVLKKKILKTVKVYAGALLNDPNVEFKL